MKLFNNILFVVAGIVAIFGFITAIMYGENIVTAIMLTCGLFIGIVCLGYLAVAAAGVVVVFVLFLIGKLIVLFALGAIFGVLGGLFKIFGS